MAGRSSSSRDPQQRPSPLQGSPGRGGGGRGRGGALGVNQSTTFAVGGGVGGGRLFGRGPEAVAYDRDKEKGLWKVGPPAGQRFSAAWLRGLSNFVAWRGQQQASEQSAAQARQRQPGSQPAAQSQGSAAATAPASAFTSTSAPDLLLEPEQGAVVGGQQQEQQVQHSLTSPERPPLTAERPEGPARPPVAVERLPGSAAEHSAEASDARAGSADAAFADAEVADADAAMPEMAGPSGSLAEADPDQQDGGDEEDEQADDALSAASSSSDMGWGDVLAASLVAPATASDSPGTDSQAPALTPGEPGEAVESAEIGTTSASPRGTATNGVAERDSGAAACSSDDSEPHRHWWPLSPPSLAAAQAVTVDAPPAGAAGGRSPAAGAAGASTPPAVPVQLSIRLERQALTDREAGMLAEWCCEHRGAADVRKLWLFDNRLGDAGAEAAARILAAHPRMQEIHLSHNMLTLRGAEALLGALPVPQQALSTAASHQAADGAAGHAGHAEDAGQAAEQHTAAAAAAGEPGPPALTSAEFPGKPCWLRLEWNRISLEGLMQVLEAQHAQRGLVVDLPSAVRADATPDLPCLPPYLTALAAAAPAARTPVPASRGGRNTLQNQVERCHARLPWISCQYQLPSEADVLRAARRGWRPQQAQQPPPLEAETTAAAGLAGGEPGTPVSQVSAAAEAAAAAGVAPAPPAAAGPLLLFPDTSALLPMLGAGASVALPTFLTLDLLASLAQQGRFGRALPPEEQVFMVVTDSVLKQLDGLKNDPGARPAIRRFLGQGLDAYGPAGADFLTVLGAHEGEGLVVEHDAAVAGSGSANVGTKGQRADHRIVEVALFFQQEIVRSDGGAGAGTPRGPAAPALSPTAFPVLLLSGDNAQVQTARSHGLPAARMSDLAAAQPHLEAALGLAGGAATGRGQQQSLTASLLRAALGAAATTGLGAAAKRSLQAEFDDAVAVLSAAVDSLALCQRQLDAVAAAASGTQGDAAAQDPAATLQSVRQALAAPEPGMAGGGVAELVAALRSRLTAWQARVRSLQDPSRLLRWTTGS